MAGRAIDIDGGVNGTGNIDRGAHYCCSAIGVDIGAGNAHSPGSITNRQRAASAGQFASDQDSAGGRSCNRARRRVDSARRDCGPHCLRCGVDVSRGRTGARQKPAMAGLGGGGGDRLLIGSAQRHAARRQQLHAATR